MFRKRTAPAPPATSTAATNKNRFQHVLPQPRVLMNESAMPTTKPGESQCLTLHSTNNNSDHGDRITFTNSGETFPLTVHESFAPETGSEDGSLSSTTHTYSFRSKMLLKDESGQTRAVIIKNSSCYRIYGFAPYDRVTQQPSNSVVSDEGEALYLWGTVSLSPSDILTSSITSARSNGTETSAATTTTHKTKGNSKQQKSKNQQQSFTLGMVSGVQYQAVRREQQQSRRRSTLVLFGNSRREQPSSGLVVLDEFDIVASSAHRPIAPSGKDKNNNNRNDAALHCATFRHDPASAASSSWDLQVGPGTDPSLMIAFCAIVDKIVRHSSQQQQHTRI